MVWIIKIGIMCVMVYVPLCWIRDLKKFARFHLLADVIILVVIIYIVTYSTGKWIEDGHGNNLNAI